MLLEREGGCHRLGLTYVFSHQLFVISKHKGLLLLLFAAFERRNLLTYLPRQPF